MAAPSMTSKAQALRDPPDLRDGAVLRLSEPRRQVGQAALPHKAAKPPDQGGRRADHGLGRTQVGDDGLLVRLQGGRVREQPPGHLAS